MFDDDEFPAPFAFLVSTEDEDVVPSLVDASTEDELVSLVLSALRRFSPSSTATVENLRTGEVVRGETSLLRLRFSLSGYVI